ncbi:MAG: nicotinate-nucleotide adenylyltransferase [Bacteroidales bacterium]|jgi:nicotinate-nucleotide adenylyltransferase|nr:nicotinate-nucleotide adenylyltransferase [Bacteroidales bacterium]
MNIGLYFGTFNPIHLGHLAIANYIVEYTDIRELWFVVSPHNPFKQETSLLRDWHRLEMVSLAIGKDMRFRACDVEFRLSKPSYTIDTLAWLHDRYPSHNFSIVMGSDNLQSLHKWKNADIIMRDYRIIIYPRPGYPIEDTAKFNNITVTDAPLMEISATFIRKAVAAGKDVRYFMPPQVWNYIEKMNFFR